jgi:hypothetical protein
MINNTDNYVKSWRCWYNNNSSEITEYNSVEHNLIDLPEDGFQAMRLWYFNGTGRFILGNDFYFFASHPSGTIYGHSNDAYTDIESRYNEVTIKRGKHTTDELINEISSLMKNSICPLST